MGYNTADPYYNPEKFGLEIVFCADEGASYEFDMFVVWKDTNGEFYYATDSGCSCPSPFEWATGLESLTQATKYDIVKEFEGWGCATAITKTELFSALFGM